jgi:hypothetical protein
MDNVVNDFRNLATADDSPHLKRKYPFTDSLQLQPRSV